MRRSSWRGAAWSFRLRQGGYGKLCDREGEGIERGHWALGLRRFRKIKQRASLNTPPTRPRNAGVCDWCGTTGDNSDIIPSSCGSQRLAPVRRPALLPSLAQLSRSRVVGASLPRHRPSLASLGATTALLLFASLALRRSSFASFVIATALQITRASLALSCRRCSPLAPSTFPCVALRHDGVAYVSRLPRFHPGVCLRRRPSSLASLVVAAASQITRASLALACRRRAPPAPSSFHRLARRHDGVADVQCLSRSHLGMCPGPRRSSFASLAITAALQITHMPLALVCRRRSPLAPSAFPRVARCRGCVACVSRLARSYLGVCLRNHRSSLTLLRSRVVDARLPRRRPSLATNQKQKERKSKRGRVSKNRKTHHRLI